MVWTTLYIPWSTPCLSRGRHEKYILWRISRGASKIYIPWATSISSTGYRVSDPQYIKQCPQDITHSIKLYTVDYIPWSMSCGVHIISCGLYPVGRLFYPVDYIPWVTCILYSVDLSCGMYFIYCGKVTISCGGYPVGNINLYPVGIWCGYSYMVWVYGVGIWCGWYAVGIWCGWYVVGNDVDVYCGYMVWIT